MDSNQLDDHVYLGLWTNWSRGAIMGATLTLTREQGNYLIAFTASFISFVAIHAWNLVVVACHRIYSNDTPRPQSTLHHHRQIVLRNSTNPEGAIASIVALVSAWWKSRARLGLLQRMAPIFCLAVLSWVAFTVAGGFSSTIASAVGNTVLLDDRACAYPKLPPMNDLPPWYALLSAQQSNSANYAKQCYSNNASSLVDCGRFLHPTIPWTTDNQTSCPFDERMCRTKNGNLRLDTGPINTAFLGLNTPPDERFSYRYVFECAPLETEGFKSYYTMPNYTLVRYHYGNQVSPDNSTFNYTYQVRDLAYQNSRGDDPGLSLSGEVNFEITEYSTETMNRKPYDGPGLWTPRTELFRPDADISLVFLSGGEVRFNDRFDDDWYRGTTPRGEEYDTTTGWSPVYGSSEAASPLGCIEQYQICSLAEKYPDGSGCGPLASRYDAFAGAALFFNTSGETVNNLEPPVDNRDATSIRWLKAWVDFNNVFFTSMIGLLGTKAFVSSNTLLYGTLYDIQRDRPMWQLDVTNFFVTVLANLQSTLVNAPIAALTTDNTMRGTISADTTVLQGLCGSQIIKSTAFTSFSMFGLCFTYGLGAIIVIASLVVKPLLRLLFKRYGYQAYKQMEWTMNGPLQLHRLAQEELGYGGDWFQCGEDVPTTENEVLLGPLEIRDQNHPSIAKPGLCSEVNIGHQPSCGDDGPSSGKSSREDENT